MIIQILTLDQNGFSNLQGLEARSSQRRKVDLVKKVVYKGVSVTWQPQTAKAATVVAGSNSQDANKLSDTLISLKCISVLI